MSVNYSRRLGLFVKLTVTEVTVMLVTSSFWRHKVGNILSPTSFTNIDRAVITDRQGFTLNLLGLILHRGP